MSLQELQQQWQKSFNEALTSIEGCITPHIDDYEDLTNFKTLSKWLLETTISPYEFMSQGWETFRYSPYSTDSLLSNIHHALLDDGEVSFVKMTYKDEILRIFMIFCWDNEDYFLPLCRKENKTLIQGRIDSVQRMNSVYLKMKEKHPEKDFPLKMVPQEEDFIFSAHHSPLQFIQEVEVFEKERNIKAENSEKIRHEFLSKMK